jgi:nitric oxide reductase activation protein
LAIDSNAKFYLPQMLGKGAFQIIHKPSFLPEALTNMYLKLIE